MQACRRPPLGLMFQGLGQHTHDTAAPVVKAPKEASMPAIAALPPAVAVDWGSSPTMMGAAATLTMQLNRLSFCAVQDDDSAAERCMARQK
jgi:hypothetical protein